MTEIRHEKDRQRYVLDVDGEIAGYAEYSLAGETRDFDHTVIEDRFQGKGLSKPLIKGALDDTKAQGIAYTATCSAVEHFIAKNPEYAL
ncbi:GNAT family N-acetyltransferase [Corynebacterium kalinowskii]|nr:GNAT family N-acetyltransferase [Corynebacterium kalinowskii]